MILPCPLKTGATITILDLSKDSFKFDRLNHYFPHEVRLVEEKKKSPVALASKAAHLAVVEVGAYLVSLANSVEDLRRIDPSVFKVSATIDKLFSKHYANGFGFVICAFNPEKKIDPHPIGYEHDLMKDGHMFVPCRHEHGHGTKDVENFDHEIYSLNTEGGHNAAGFSRADLGDGKGQPVAKDVPRQFSGESTFELYRDAANSEAEALKSEVLTKYLPIVKAFRQRLIRGKFKNDDLIFSIA